MKMRDINKFVFDNFNILYQGACKIGIKMEEDNYTTKRIRINKTVLHNDFGLEYADGHWYGDVKITEGQILQTVKDLQILLDAAGYEPRKIMDLEGK